MDLNDSMAPILSYSRYPNPTAPGVHYYDYEADLRNNDPPAKPGPSYPTAPRWAYNQADASISHINSVEGHSVRAGSVMVLELFSWPSINRFASVQVLAHCRRSPCTGHRGRRSSTRRPKTLGQYDRAEDAHNRASSAYPILIISGS
jgi:hypothetical protein